MLHKIHEGYLGFESCLQRAREVFYWPMMNAEIKDYVSNCSICNTLRPSQCREPLRPYEIPERPWSKVATDLFTFNGENFVVIVDFYSNFIEMEKINRTSSQAVIQVLKKPLDVMVYLKVWFLIMVRYSHQMSLKSLHHSGNSDTSPHPLTTHNPMGRL